MTSGDDLFRVTPRPCGARRAAPALKMPTSFISIVASFPLVPLYRFAVPTICPVPAILYDLCLPTKTFHRPTPTDRSARIALLGSTTANRLGMHRGKLSGTSAGKAARKDPGKNPRIDPRKNPRKNPRIDPRKNPRIDPRKDPRIDPRKDLDFSRYCLPLRDKQHRSGIENASIFLIVALLFFPSPRCPAVFSLYFALHCVCPTRTFAGKNGAASIPPLRGQGLRPYSHMPAHLPFHFFYPSIRIPPRTANVPPPPNRRTQAPYSWGLGA